MDDGVAPDGSPVAVYRAIPPGRDLELVVSVVPPHARILDLGCGTGRIANPLAAAGHAVVAVDDSPEMLAYVDGAETLLADLWTLDLGRRFDVVLALSHLVNDPTAARREQLLTTCGHHLADGGRVIVQRHQPDWVPAPKSGRIGEVSIELHDVELRPGGLRAATTYRLGDRQWTQRWEADLVDDQELERSAAIAGLRVDRVLDPERMWVVLTAAA